MTLSEFLHFFPTPLELVRCWPLWLALLYPLTIYLNSRHKDYIASKENRLRPMRREADEKCPARSGTLRPNSLV